MVVYRTYSESAGCLVRADRLVSLDLRNEATRYRYY